MKRENIFIVLSSFVISILLLNLILRFTNLRADAGLIVIWLACFVLICAISISILAITKNKKSKANCYQLLATINGLLAMLSFIFALQGKIIVIKNIAYVIFICVFVMLIVFCGLWAKHEKN